MQKSIDFSQNYSILPLRYKKRRNMMLRNEQFEFKNI